MLKILKKKKNIKKLMIKKDFITKNYITMGNEDKIETYNAEGEEAKETRRKRK